MYVCGITPYDESHVGHGRAYVAFDVIRRYLVYLGYEVTYVQNITDVDDKIIEKSKLQTSNLKNKPENTDLKQMCAAVAEQYTDAYFEVMDKLNVKRADIYPKATAHIPEMVKWINGLMDKGAAYVLKDGVYFEVDKDADYGKLSGKKKEEQEAGARVDVHEEKKSPLDFALWKFAKPGEPSWPSPWGEGRPGWHIECSVMSTKYLGEQFEIHGGGLDLEFPHHENELAQTESLTGKVPWVKYWIHNGFVNINKQKMSKSLGNFFTLKDVFAKFDPMVVRLFFLMTHYRSPINYSDKDMEESETALLRISSFLTLSKRLSAKDNPIAIVKIGYKEQIEIAEHQFKAAMDDDFNTAKALAAIFDLINHGNFIIAGKGIDPEAMREISRVVNKLCDILGLKVRVVDPKEYKIVQEVVNHFDNARENKNF
jgi:cysteinyl-tRNA synthetase